MMLKIYYLKDNKFGCGKEKCIINNKLTEAKGLIESNASENVEFTVVDRQKNLVTILVVIKAKLL